MCGRFTLRASPALVEEAFGHWGGLPATLVPRYNIAPTQMILALRQLESAQPTFCTLRWGLIPSWAEDKSIANRLLNARADGIATKPAFRAAFKRRRCLIVTDGFYEWQTKLFNEPAAEQPKSRGSKPQKQPFHIHRPDDRPFAFAGLWETWSKGETPIESCTIITTDANGLMAPMHDRMPVILDPKEYARWLSPQPADPAIFLELLRPCPDEFLRADPVGFAVNNARQDSPECLKPFDAESQISNLKSEISEPKMRPAKSKSDDSQPTLF